MSGKSVADILEWATGFNLASWSGYKGFEIVEGIFVPLPNEGGSPYLEKPTGVMPMMIIIRMKR